MKKTLLQNLKFIAFGIALAITASYAAAYTAPTGAAPSNDASTPINVGVINQVKAGNLSVNAFTAAQNAQIDGETFIEGIVYGGNGTTDDSAIWFGDSTSETNFSVIEYLKTKTFIRSSSIAYAGTKTLCATTEGEVVFCPVATTQCSDGVDNADPEDSLVDMNDPGCSSPADNDETDSPFLYALSSFYVLQGWTNSLGLPAWEAEARITASAQGTVEVVIAFDTYVEGFYTGNSQITVTIQNGDSMGFTQGGAMPAYQDYEARNACIYDHPPTLYVDQSYEC